MNHIYQIVFNRSQQCYQAVAETATSQGKTKASKLATSGHIAVKPNAAANLAKPTSLAKPILLKPIAFSVLLAFSAQLFSGVALAEPTGGQVTAGAGTINQAGTTTTINQTTQNMAIDWHTFNVRANEAVNFNQPNANAIALNRVTGTESSSIMGSLTANGKVFILNPNGVLFGNGAQVNVGGLVASTLSLSNANFMAGNFNFTGNGNNASIVNNANINIAQGGTLAFIAPVIKNNGTIIASQGSVILAAADDVTLTLQNGGLTSYTLNKGNVQTLIDNGGLIQADGGYVVLTAKGLDALSQSAINQTGIIEAQTVSSINGKIELLGDMQIGTLNVSGKLDASAPASKNATGGDGGFVETSAAKVNIADNTFVTTKSDNGKTGTWLIDPTDFNINAGSGARTGSTIGATTLSNNLRNNNIEIATIATGAGKGDIFVNSAVNWSSNLLTLSAHGDIQVNANLNGTGSAQLALEGSNISGYYYLNNGAKINLPSGINLFLTTRNSDGTINETDSFSVINNIAELNAIRLNLNAVLNNQETYVNYALGSDLDMSSVDNFIPIGGSQLASIHMGGRFHGLGHEISNLSIHDANYDSIGLFALVGNEIKDLHLVDVNFRRNTSFTVGGIAGHNFGNIANCSVTGNIEGRHQFAVGGIVGVNQGTISETYSTAEVISTFQSGAAGGLVGDNQGFVYTSYATGAVGNAGYATGGLVGDNENVGIISNSYSTGEVFGTLYSGGLVGNNDGYIENSYAIGKVAGTLSAAGLVDNFAEVGPVINSYWNTQTSGETRSAGGVGLTTAEMQSINTYRNAGWNISDQPGSDSIWRISAGDYPRLRPLTEGTITIDASQLNIKAPNVKKVYDGVPVNSVSDLMKMQGWGNGFTFLDGLAVDNTTLNAIKNSITYGGSWKNAQDANTDQNPLYTIEPQGVTGVDTQKYDIKYTNGTLVIEPRPVGATIVGLPVKNFDGTTFIAFNSNNIRFDGFVNGEGAVANYESGGHFLSPNIGEQTVRAFDFYGDFTANLGTNLSNYVMPSFAIGTGRIAITGDFASVSEIVGQVYRNGYGNGAIASGNGLMVNDFIAVSRDSGAKATIRFADGSSLTLLSGDVLQIPSTFENTNLTIADYLREHYLGRNTSNTGNSGCNCIIAGVRG